MPRRLPFLVVNSLTSLNLLIGLAALLAATQGSPWAAWGLMLCFFLDGGDGYLARRWDVSTRFGEQMDLLADLVSFVLASGVLYAFWMHGAGLSLWAAGPTVAFYVLCGAIRLARFSVDPVSVPGGFAGIPTTAAAALTAVAFLALPGLPWPAVAALAVSVGLLMVSTLPYPKPSATWHYAVMLLSFVLFGAWLKWWPAIGAMALLYLAAGPLRWVRARAGVTT